MSRHLYFVRHGETEGDSSTRFHGRNDVRLSHVGRAQIEALAPLVADLRVAAVLHSPLARARESAEILAKALAHAPTQIASDAALAEIWFGACEGMTEAEIRATFPEWHAEWKAGRALAFPGGDTLTEFQARVVRGLDAVLARHPEGDLLIVSHRGVIRRGLVHLLGVPDEGGRFGVDLASLTVIRDARPRELVRLNARPG